MSVSSAPVSMDASASLPASTPSAPPARGGVRLIEWLCLGLGVAAAVKTSSVIYHVRQCQRRETIIRELVAATESNMPRLLMPPIVINEADPTASATARATSSASGAAASAAAPVAGSTTIRILSVTERRPSIISSSRQGPSPSSASASQTAAQNSSAQAPSSTSTHAASGLWRKTEGDALNRSDRLHLEKVLSRVHLFMQPRWTLSPNMSPACTMLEAFLRLNKIPYTAHVVRVLNNRDVVGKARDTDIPQEEGRPQGSHVSDEASASYATFLGAIASGRPGGMTKSTLQFMDAAAGLAYEKLNEFDDLHRRLPFIVYRGEVISGSYDTITSYLMEKFCLPDLAARADGGRGDHVALAQALRRTMMFTLDMQYKVSFVLEAPRVFARYAAPAMGYSSWAMWLWLSLPWFSKLKTDVRRSLRVHDLGALTRDQFHLTALRDMEMIEALLRNPDYTADAADDEMATGGEEDGRSSQLGGGSRPRRQTSLTPRSLGSSMSQSWGAAAGMHGGAAAAGGGATCAKRHPSQFLFSPDTPSREDCVLYAYLMPMMRLSYADVDSMPAEANDAIRFAHESEVFADFVERMTTRAFPDFDRMVCLILGINPAQLFISRYSAPSGGEEVLTVPRDVNGTSAATSSARASQLRRRGASGGAAAPTRQVAAGAAQPTFKPTPVSRHGAQTTSVYEDSLRASASHSVSATPTLSSLSTTKPPTTSDTLAASPPVPTLSPAAVRLAEQASRAPPAATATAMPATTTTMTAAQNQPSSSSSSAPHPSVPKLALPVSNNNAPRISPAAPAAPAVAPTRPQTQQARVPSSTTDRRPPATRAAPAVVPPAVAPPPVVRYTPSNPSVSASAIRKTRPTGLSTYGSPRV